MRNLTEEEISLISGAFGPPGAVAGGIIAGAGYLGQNAGAGTGSMTGFATTVGAGAAVGFVAGPTTVAGTVLGSTVSFYGGMAGGLMERGFQSMGSAS